MNLKHYAATALGLLFLTPCFADFDVGLNAYKNGDFDTAFDNFRSEAVSGNARAQFNLGVMYYRGEGVGKDYVRAYAWIELSTQSRSDTELEEAQGVLSVMLTPEEIRQAQVIAAELARQHELHYTPQDESILRIVGT